MTRILDPNLAGAVTKSHPVIRPTIAAEQAPADLTGLAPDPPESLKAPAHIGPSPAPEPDPPPPDAPEIPGYRVRASVGRGGMAEVWLADRQTPTGIDIPCVVKRILPAYADDPAFRERFLDEARIVASLRHSNLVAVTDAGYAGHTLFLAMEWIDGCDLSRLLLRVRQRGGEFPLRHALFVVREVAAGLHHAHTARGPLGEPLEVVHRDISPGNVLVSRQGAVKLADFGVARGGAARRPERRGTLAGKVQYFAPELFRGAGASPRTDVFAVGVVLYEALTLRPFVDRKLPIPDVRDQLLRFDPRRLVEKDLTMPDGVEQILLRALSARPDERYQTALELLEDVNDFAYESGLRLLDAHFAPYVQRLLDEPAPTRRPVRAPGGEEAAS
jgi:serine/threonine-protein kinase